MKRYDSALKAKVALEAIKGERAIAEIAIECGVHPNQIAKWKKQLLEEVPEIFSKGRKQNKRKTEDLESELYEQIGQLKVELDWLKKISPIRLNRSVCSLKGRIERFPFIVNAS